MEAVLVACDCSRLTTKIHEALETKIERVIREHLVAQQEATRTAVERAFGKMMPPLHTATRRGSAPGRRASSTLAELAEQLFKAVQAYPGETMTVIAARVGEGPRALQRPMRSSRGPVESAAPASGTSRGTSRAVQRGAGAVDAQRAGKGEGPGRISRFNRGLLQSCGGRI